VPTQRKGSSAPRSVPRSVPAPEPQREHPLRRRFDRSSDRPERARSDHPDIDHSVHPDTSMLDYRVKSRDEQGLPKKWSLEVPPSFDAEVRRMIDEGRYFADLGTMIRWCVFFGMDFLQRLIAPPFPSNLQVLKAMAANNAHVEARLAYMAAIDRTATNAYELLGRGMEGAAINILSRQLDEIRKLPKEDEFRPVILDLLKQRFGHLLKRGELVTFDELDEE
jgi:hypothetical protein